MSTNAEFVSRCIGNLNVLSKDEHISRRQVLAIGRDKAKTYIAQKLGDRTLFQEESLFKDIDCFEMEQTDIIKCPFIEFRRCKILMKSKLELPTLFHSKYGASIIRVISIDDSTEFNYSNAYQSNSNDERQFGKVVKKYYVKGKYLYIPDFSVKAVNISLLTSDVKEAVEASGCTKCDKCKSVWDYEFICPDKLYEPIVQETIQELLNTVKRLPKDENPNMDSNQKNQTIL